jgi:hypothetical protein
MKTHHETRVCQFPDTKQGRIRRNERKAVSAAKRAYLN